MGNITKGFIHDSHPEELNNAESTGIRMKIVEEVYKVPKRGPLLQFVITARKDG